MSTSNISRHLAAIAIPALAAMPLLAACSSEDSGSDSAASSTSSSAVGETGAASESSEAMDAGREGSADSEGSESASAPTIEAEPVNNLSDGDSISVTLSGLDTDYGYYAAICAAEKTPGNPVPDCTGDRSSTPLTQQWITNKDGGTTPIAEDGTASFDLGVSSTGEVANCTEQDCVLKLFGDHTEGFEDIAEIPVTFAK